jgi:hypothetical protein
MFEIDEMIISLPSLPFCLHIRPMRLANHILDFISLSFTSESSMAPEVYSGMH